MICSIEDCSKPIAARTWCMTHYRRWKRTGSTKGANGYSRLPEYTIWLAIKSRCTNPKAAGYKHYGGRGISMSQQWHDSFENFYKDMGPRPSHKHSIDRIDVNGNYEPGNCRWAVGYLQAWNRRKNSRNTSGYIGISKYNKTTKWVAKIKLIDGEIFYLGAYDYPEEAAIAYDQAIIFFRGYDGITNIL